MYGSHRCKLDLLYRGTQDGFTSASFFNKCENISPTITFIKSKQHGRVFEGYTTKNWGCKNGYIEDKEAFLFSLTHGEKYPIKTPQYAIIGRPDYILAFGGGHDIVISEGCTEKSDKTYSNFTHSYKCSKFGNFMDSGAKEYLAGSHQFSVEEIEVYQVVWS